MPSCEKCWRDAHGDSKEYRRLISSGKVACTPEEQAGPEATLCPRCQRMTRHQGCRVCMICGRGPVSEPEEGGKG
jgi:hypothetical protein